MYQIQKSKERFTCGSNWIRDSVCKRERERNEEGQRWCQIIIKAYTKSECTFLDKRARISPQTYYNTCTTCNGERRIYLELRSLMHWCDCERMFLVFHPLLLFMFLTSKKESLFKYHLYEKKNIQPNFIS